MTGLSTVFILPIALAAQEANLGKLFLEKDPCAFPKAIEQSAWASTDIDRIKTGIGLLNAWQTVHGASDNCLPSLPPVSMVWFQVLHEGPKTKVLTLISSGREGDPGFTLVAPSGESLAFKDKYVGLANGSPQLNWIHHETALFPGLYTLKWDHGKRSFPFLFCTDFVSENLIRARVVRVETGGFQVEADFQSSLCITGGEKRHISMVAFAGNPQTPSIWNLDQDVPHAPAASTIKVPLEINNVDRNVTIFVSYSESYRLFGISFQRESQVSIHL